MDWSQTSPCARAEIQKQEGHRNGGKEKIYFVIFLLACQMVCVYAVNNPDGDQAHKVQTGLKLSLCARAEIQKWW
jgi:hypothetical protein